MSISTDRLTLHRTKAADWNAIQQIWEDQKRSEYGKFDRPNDTADSAVMPRIAKWASFADSSDHIFFSVFLEKTMIGYISLHRRPDSYECGYCFSSRFQGKGYARESLSAAIRYVKELGCTAVTAGTALENTPSVRLLRSLGFVLTKTETVSFCEGSAFAGGIFTLMLSESDPG